jgi:hypothetical protein
MENLIKEIKDGIFTVGIDDSVHERGGKREVKLFFIFCRGPFIEKVTYTYIEVDGLNATEAIIRVLLSEKKERFSIIVTHGITVGGFNLFDIEKIWESIKKPIISVTENKPMGDSMLKALKKLPNQKTREEIFGRAGPLLSVQTELGSNKLFFHIKGISEELAKKFLKKFAIRSRLPEQLLLAHKIASGWENTI